MALGELVLEDSGQITGIRVLSTDASGTTLELSLQLSGTIRGVGQNTLGPTPCCNGLTALSMVKETES